MKELWELLPHSLLKYIFFTTKRQVSVWSTLQYAFEVKIPSLYVHAHSVLSRTLPFSIPIRAKTNTSKSGSCCLASFALLFSTGNFEKNKVEEWNQYLFPHESHWTLFSDANRRNSKKGMCQKFCMHSSNNLQHEFGINLLHNHSVMQKKKIIIKLKLKIKNFWLLSLKTF